MSSNATLAPSDARRSLYARPIPCAAPVTTIALSPSRMCTLPSLRRLPLDPRRGVAVPVRGCRPPRGDPHPPVPAGRIGARAARCVPQVPADEDRHAAVVACELRGRAVGVTGADGLEELRVVLGRVLQRRPAQRPRDLLAQSR